MVVGLRGYGGRGNGEEWLVFWGRELVFTMGERWFEGVKTYEMKACISVSDVCVFTFV